MEEQKKLNSDNDEKVIEINFLKFIFYLVYYGFGIFCIIFYVLLFLDFFSDSSSEVRGMVSYILLFMAIPLNVLYFLISGFINRRKNESKIESFILSVQVILLVFSLMLIYLV